MDTNAILNAMADLEEDDLMEMLQEIMKEKHFHLTGGAEEINMIYEPCVTEESFS